MHLSPTVDRFGASKSFQRLHKKGKLKKQFLTMYVSSTARQRSLFSKPTMKWEIMIQSQKLSRNYRFV